MEKTGRKVPHHIQLKPLFEPVRIAGTLPIELHIIEAWILMARGKTKSRDGSCLTAFLSVELLSLPKFEIVVDRLDNTEQHFLCMSMSCVVL